MPLGMLIALVVGGIAGIAVLTHVLGMSGRASLDTADAARAAWLREYPRIAPHAVTLARDGHAALIDTGEGPGIVWSLGADTTARLLQGARVARTTRGLDIRLPDTTAPRIALRLDPEEAEAWARRTQRHSA